LAKNWRFYKEQTKLGVGSKVHFKSFFSQRSIKLLERVTNSIKLLGCFCRQHEEKVL
jgi:hypothetical protein